MHKMIKLFKKYKFNGYGVIISRYYYQDHIPEKLDYWLRKIILRAWHSIFGHHWNHWTKFSYVPKGGTGFATIEPKQTRNCWCYAFQERDWSKKNQKLLADMQKRLGTTLRSGLIGELYGIRFLESKSSPGVTIK